MDIIVPNVTVKVKAGYHGRHYVVNTIPVLKILLEYGLVQIWNLGSAYISRSVNRAKKV